MDGVDRRRFAVEVEGRRLAVEELSPAERIEGPSLVFLHEGLGCIGMWRDFPGSLCSRLRLPGIVYDRLGYGASDPPEGPRGLRYLHEEAERWLPGLLDALEVREALLVGHSDGGTIALLFAAAFPERVRALAAIAAHVLVEDATIAGIRAAGDAYARGALKARLARHQGERTDALFRAWADTWLAPWFRGWNVEGRLPRLAGVPALIVQGEADAYATPAHVEAIVRGIGPSARPLLLPGLGHAPHLEDRERLVDEVASFLAGVLPNRVDRSGRSA